MNLWLSVSKSNVSVRYLKIIQSPQDNAMMTFRWHWDYHKTLCGKDTILVQGLQEHGTYRNMATLHGNCFTQTDMWPLFINPAASSWFALSCRKMPQENSVWFTQISELDFSCWSSYCIIYGVNLDSPIACEYFPLFHANSSKPYIQQTKGLPYEGLKQPPRFYTSKLRVLLNVSLCPAVF